MEDVKPIEVTHAVLSAKVDMLELKVEELIGNVQELIALKHKGLGAFWLASIILAGAFTAMISAVGSWFRSS